ncbi:SGNH/GDSL hydrolase family protein [Myroides fluvii]|uniref:SGNH/GDSL hydrolase family protein n=1 Tax=Myroides fluvii TaxID=2572594 RepID=UPI00131BAC4D|nr:SGNH/GDSL hydrolase family protein [Myroides fluvii]
MRKVIGILLCLQSFCIVAQTDKKMSYHEIDPPFYRVDTLKYKDLPSGVKHTGRHSAGLYVDFKTNSKSIKASWCVNPAPAFSYLSEVNRRGLDLYAKVEGVYQYVRSGFPDTVKDCTEAVIIDQLTGEEREYRLYFPVYSELATLQIGVEEEATFQETPTTYKKRVLVYGSSIAQGASASRPGMAYPAQLERKLGHEFLNYGFGGSAKMEASVAELLADIPAVDLLIMDCVPNSSVAEIKQRTAAFVAIYRKKNPQVPIVMIPSVIREVGYFNTVIGQRVTAQNQQFRIEYEALIKEGVQNIYYLDVEHLLGTDHEGTSDGVHPTDLGFARWIETVQPHLEQVFNRYF